VGTVKDMAPLAVGELEEEQGEAKGIGLGNVGMQVDAPVPDKECAVLDQVREGGALLHYHLPEQDVVDGAQATGLEEAAIITPAGEHGRKIGRQFVPCCGMGEFPEDGIKEVARVSTGTTAGGGTFFRRDEGGDELPEGGGEEVKIERRRRTVDG
jgi:hypothetical protein